MKIHDISKELTSSLAVWPGSIPFERKIIKDYDERPLQESEIRLNVHTGTHIDAPLHFVKSGKAVVGVPLEKLIGKFQVIDCGDLDVVDADFLNSIKLESDMLLLKTKNSDHDKTVFNKNFVALTSEAAKILVEKKIKSIGVDGHSVQLFFDKTPLTHHVLLQNEMAVIEGLNLKGIKPGIYFGVILPMNIPDAEGAPARAILIEGI